MTIRSWHARVGTYLDELDQVAIAIDAILETTRVDTSGVNAAGVEQSIGQLQLSLVELEDKIAQRATLLKAPDAPADGATLAAKLLATGKLDDAVLARRSDQVAARLAEVHHRAISLFVCQYHLAQFTSEMAQLLTGSASPSTYAAPGSDAGGAAPRGSDSGGLFNASA